MVTAAPATFAGPLTALPVTLARLREVLIGHGFTGGAVAGAIGAPLPFGKAHLRDDLPVYLRRLETPSPINTLIKLFVLDRGVDEIRARQAFAPLELEDVIELGLVEHGPRGIRARVRLSAHEGLILAHDAYDEETRAVRPDHVLDVNPTTISLSHLTVRRPVARALEIGTGCGVLALLASRHAGHVVATDTNPRALNLAVFNAALNGITNVEWRMGSLFDAVESERFDLIVCNPPYVISPDTQFIFRDGGRRGDALCAEIVRAAPAYLTDGGFATVLVNWAITGDEPWAAPLERWVEGRGCDAWLMLSATQDPLTYAATWTRSRDRDQYAAALDRWTRYFADLGIAQLGLGAVVLRRRAGATPWVRADQVAESITAPASDHLERLFAAEDRLASLASDEALLACRFRAAPDHRLHQVLAAADGHYAIESASVRLLGGLPFSGTVDTYATQVLARCDGRHTLAEVAAAVAADAGLDAAAFTAACSGIARRLVAMGFLI